MQFYYTVFDLDNMLMGFGTPSDILEWEEIDVVPEEPEEPEEEESSNSGMIVTICILTAFSLIVMGAIFTLSRKKEKPFAQRARADTLVEEEEDEEYWDKFLTFNQISRIICLN